MSYMLLKATEWLQNKRAAVAQEEGQGTIEYILVLGVIVVGIFSLVTMTGLGAAIEGALTAVVNLFIGPNPIA